MFNDRKKYRELKENPDVIQELREALAVQTKARATEQEKYKTLVKAVADFFRKNIAKNDVLRKPEKLGALQDVPELGDDLRISLKPDARERQGMTRTRGF